MDIERIEIIGGMGRDGRKETVERVTLAMGQVASVIGPTGSGKTALITDIELFASGGTPSGRKILINGEPPTEELIDKPSTNPVAIITQHTNFLSDLPVDQFLAIHARTRGAGENSLLPSETLDFANQLTGEPIAPKSPMTQLSGGQTRALLIADAVVIGRSPILLLDEIENAGINRARALELLKERRKIFIFVTHDPRIALLSDLRVVMEQGAMKLLIHTSAQEKALAAEIALVDAITQELKTRLWRGEALDSGPFPGAYGAASEKLAMLSARFAPIATGGPKALEPDLIQRAAALGRIFMEAPK